MNIRQLSRIVDSERKTLSSKTEFGTLLFLSSEDEPRIQVGNNRMNYVSVNSNGRLEGSSDLLDAAISANGDLNYVMGDHWEDLEAIYHKICERFSRKHGVAVKDASSARQRQLEKSLNVWKERLEKDPTNKKIQKMVSERQKQLDDYLSGSESSKEAKEVQKDLNEEQQTESKVKKVVSQIPTIKNSKDLYTFAEQCGINYKDSRGKAKSSDWIKAEIAKVIWNQEHPNEEMPPQISPMLIKDITAEGKDYVDKHFTKDKWSLQQKINGQRLILCLNPDGTTNMTSRARSVKTFRYSELDNHVLGLQNLKSPFKGRTILDGEIICDNPNIKLPSGVETTSTLQSTVALMHMNSEDSLKFQKDNGFSLRYKVFDILMLDGEDVQKEPYSTRKDLVYTACTKIKELNPDCSIDILPVIDDYESAWDEFEKYVSEGGEGLILKKKDAPYEQGKRTRNQWKLKGRLTIDAYVTGYVSASEDKSLKDFIGGLVFSTHYHGKEIEIAAVSNLTMYDRKRFTDYDSDGNPVLKKSMLGTCAELCGQNFKEGSLRLGSARIENWRDDKNPEDCVLQDEMIRYDR